MTTQIATATCRSRKLVAHIEQQRVRGGRVVDATARRDRPRVAAGEPRVGGSLVVVRVDAEDVQPDDPQQVDGDEPGGQPDPGESEPEPFDRGRHPERRERTGLSAHGDRVVP